VPKNASKWGPAIDVIVNVLGKKNRRKTGNPLVWEERVGDQPGELGGNSGDAEKVRGRAQELFKGKSAGKQRGDCTRPSVGNRGPNEMGGDWTFEDLGTSDFRKNRAPIHGVPRGEQPKQLLTQRIQKMKQLICRLFGGAGQTVSAARKDNTTDAACRSKEPRWPS